MKSVCFRTFCFKSGTSFRSTGSPRRFPFACTWSNPESSYQDELAMHPPELPFPRRVILRLFMAQINYAMRELEVEFAITRFRGPQDAQTPPAELICPSASAMSTSRFGVDNVAQSSAVAAERPERLDASYEPQLIGRECGWVQHIGEMLRVAGRRRPIPCPSLSI
jgi:hypothetical protein